MGRFLFPPTAGASGGEVSDRLLSTGDRGDDLLVLPPGLNGFPRLAVPEDLLELSSWSIYPVKNCISQALAHF